MDESGTADNEEEEEESQDSEEDFEPPVRGRGRGSRGGRGRARARGGGPSRARGKGRGRGRGRGRGVVDPQANMLNPIGVGRGRARGRGKGKGRARGPGAAWRDRVETEPLSDDGEEHDADDVGEVHPVSIMPGLGENEPAEEHPDSAAELIPDSELQWGDVDDELDKDKILRGTPNWGGSETPGTTRIPGAEKMTVFQIFLTLFPLWIWERIVTETNDYARIAISKSFYPNARAWTPITTGELLVWVSLCLGMAVMGCDNYTRFWSGFRFGTFQYPDLSSIMSQMRWEQIKRYLHLKSNVGRPNMDSREGKCWQFEWLEIVLTRLAKEAWNPAQEMCVDERSIPSRHKYNPIRVFNPNKPHKFSCNQQSLVDKAGYQYHTWFYDRVKRVGLKCYIMGLMVASLPHKGFRIAADRWYGMISAAQVVRNAGHSFTATCTKAYVPTKLLVWNKNNMEPGDYHYCVCDEINLQINIWCDKNIVNSMSTDRRPYGGTVARNNGATMDPQRPAPENIVWYNEVKAMVDGFDGKCLGMGSIEMAMTSHKWWHAPFFGLLDGVFVNLDTICRSVGVTNGRFETYTTLCTQLQENNIDAPMHARNRSAENATDDAGRQHKHTGSRLRFVGNHIGAHSPKRGECIVCIAQNFGKYGWKRRKVDGPKLKVKKPPKFFQK